MSASNGGAGVTHHPGGTIYILRDPRDMAVRYVGQTADEETRRKHHERNRFQGNIQKSEWGWDLSKAGLVPLFEVIEQCPIMEMNSRERHWVIHFSRLGCRLLNRPVGAIKRTDLINSDDIHGCMAEILAAEELLLSAYHKVMNRFPKNSSTSSRLYKAVEKVRSAKWALDHWIEENA
jgi:hypothetical protein